VLKGKMDGKTVKIFGQANEGEGDIFLQGGLLE